MPRARRPSLSALSRRARDERRASAPAPSSLRPRACWRGIARRPHWRYAGELQRRHPGLKIDADRIFIREDDVWTSAGITAGIDLALAMIEEDCGIDTSKAIARDLVVYHRRSGGRSQFSTMLELEPRPGRIRDTLAYARRATIGRATGRCRQYQPTSVCTAVHRRNRRDACSCHRAPSVRGRAAAHRGDDRTARSNRVPNWALATSTACARSASGSSANRHKRCGGGAASRVHGGAVRGRPARNVSNRLNLFDSGLSLSKATQRAQRLRCEFVERYAPRKQRLPPTNLSGYV